jgi:hypothetical protein
MKDFLTDLRESVLFLLAMNRSIAAGQVLKLVLRHGSDQTRQVMSLEALRNEPFMQLIAPHIAFHQFASSPFSFEECDEDCEDCDIADEDDETLH